MLDVKQQIVSTLSPILPTYYELICDSTTELPCITYMESNNADNLYGDDLGYSNIQFCIKVWGYVVDDIMGYAQQIDSAMRSIGYKRTSSNELIVGNQIEKVIYYDGLGLENFN